MFKHLFILSVALLIILLFPLHVTADASFDHDYVISDYDFTNYILMTVDEIQLFLEAGGGILGNYTTTDIDGKKKLASEIIYRAAVEYRINPQVLITLVQKEQTLVTRFPKKPTQLDWATGFGAYDGRRPVERFRGFTTQIDRAAWRLRYFLEHPWEFRYRAGQTDRVDWHKVTPQNTATAALYNYTPHLKGNKLFFKIWQKWFGAPIGTYADGSLLRAKGEPGVWFIQNGKRRPFKSKTVFLLNYSFKNIQEVDTKELQAYEIGEPMRFPNYSLVRASLGELFMLTGNKKRPITEGLFKAIGFHPEEVIDVEGNDLDFYELSKPIISPYPTGALLQDRETYGVYYVKEDTKYPIVDESILYNNYPYNSIIKVDPEKLDSFKTGPHVTFRDGILIKANTSSAVYVISNGERLPIISSETFEALGYQWESIITISQPILEMHPLGEVLRVE
ncbi:hypothetical protein MYX06_05010 [Patescibacteria group bacterium AH-259-L05]|nr:hypothetical protein [Patescibacteria group bacterium AH-259-L05]